MEIPKNTTQIGEIKGNRKIFIEDYVISYIKQLCRREPDCRKRIAFYGVVKTQQEQEYYFIYGGCRINTYGRNDYYLTAEDYKEITEKGEMYFEGYTPIGFITIEDELPEGVFVLGEFEQYIRGYHIFYEKNDSMLTFLIDRQSNDVPDEEAQEETVADETGEDKAQVPQSDIPPINRERKMMPGREPATPPEGVKMIGIVKSAAAALFIVLCVTAISAINGLGKMESVKSYFQKAYNQITEKKIPDREEAVETNVEMTVQPNPAMVVQTDMGNSVPTDVEETAPTNVEASQPTDVEATVPAVVEETSPTEADIVMQNNIVDEGKIQTDVSDSPQSYIIKSGETLISISKAFYGDDSKVKEICDLNGIEDSDNIQVGQKIILP